MIQKIPYNKTNKKFKLIKSIVISYLIDFLIVLIQYIIIRFLLNYLQINSIMRIGRVIRNFFTNNNKTGMNNKNFSKEELKKRLSSEQYRVTQ